MALWELHGGVVDWPDDEEVRIVLTYRDGLWYGARRIVEPEIGASPFRDKSVEWEGTLTGKMFGEEYGFWLYFGDEFPPPRPPGLCGWQWLADAGLEAAG